MTNWVVGAGARRASHRECPRCAVIARWLGAEVASVIPTYVEANDPAASCPREWDQYGANVATVASNEQTHNGLPMF